MYKFHFACLSMLIASCATPQIGTLSTTPVEFGKNYELASANASGSHSRPILFGVTFGEEKNFGQIVQEVQQKQNCDVMKNVEFSVVAAQYLGFGQNTASITGKCLRAK